VRESWPGGAKACSVVRLNHYKGLLIRRWWVLALGSGVGLAIAGVLWWYRPPNFISVGRMIVSIKLAIPEGSVYSEELGNFLGTQAALMRSGVVLNRAQARLLSGDPGLSLQPIALKVAVSPKTSIFVLEATGSDPKCVQAFLQACMEEYVKFKKEMRTQTSETTVAGLTEEVMRLGRDLRGCDEDLMRFQRSNSVVLLQEQGNSVGSYLATLNQRLVALKSEEALLHSLSPDQSVRWADEHNDRFPVSQSPTEGSAVLSTGSDPATSEFLKARQQISLLKAEQADLGQYLRPKHPKMLGLTEDIARRERLVGILLHQAASAMENHKASLGKQVSCLEENLVEWNAKALDCSQKMAEYQRLKANQQRVQSLYDRLLATLQTLDLNKEINAESVTILEQASPAFQDPRNAFSKFLTAGLLGIGLSVGLIFFLDRVDDRVNSFTELQDWFEESVLVQIPLEPPARRREGVSLLAREDGRHAFVEAFRSLRSSLLFQTSDCERPKILLVTSSVPNEGKSLLSANLAIVIAAAEARVLLVDADLRKGVLHEKFGLMPRNGLSEVLSDQSSWEEAVLPTRFSGLYLLPRGKPTSASSELFLAQPAQQFLSRAATSYDFIILDAPPIMAADDVTSLAPRADTVLFVLRAERTSARVAHAALEMLYRRKVKVLGIVFNAVRPSNADYYTYTRYEDDYRSYPTTNRNLAHNPEET